MKRPRFIFISVFCLVLFVLNSSHVFAHSGWFDIDITSSDPCTVGHDDADPFKGWAYITVSNSMTEDWGDFHFEIYEFADTNVFFSVNSPYEPNMLDEWGADYVDYTYALDGTQKLDFTFYDNPVEPGDTVTFEIYTDNTLNENAWFGITMYPTPVPEPATLLLLGIGGLFLLRKRK